MQKNRRNKELLILTIICAVFIGVFPDLNGPRQRLFFEPLLSLIGTIGFYGILKNIAYMSRH